MKNSGKILRAGFWILLLGSIVLGFFKITEHSSTEHFRFVPDGVKGVAVFDGRQISKKFVERFQFNPSALEDLIPPGVGEEGNDFNPLDLGLHPYHKVVLFHFDLDGKNMVAALVQCDSRKFLSYFDQLHGEDLQLIEENNDIGTVVKRFSSSMQDVCIVAGPGIGIYCSTADGSSLEDSFESKLVPFLTSAIKDPATALLAVNQSFQEFEKRNNDIGYWSVGENQSFGALSDDFIESQTFLDFDKGKVHITSELEFDGDCPIKEEIRPLVSAAPFAVSFMANQASATHFVEQNVPSRFHTYFTDFAGDFFLEITGHQLFQGYRIESQFDEDFNETEVRVENDEKTAFPEFIAVFSVNDPVAYNSALDADSNTLCVDGFYVWEVIDGMKCYISTNENDVCISNNKEHVIARANKNLDEVYATYSMQIDFPALHANLPMKGDIGIDIPKIIIHQGFSQLNFAKLEVNATEIKDNVLVGKGTFTFADEDQHSIDALVELANKGLAMRSVIEAMIFQSSDREAK